MNKLTYRGYTARIEFDERDEIFVGRVLGIRAIIGFHGNTVAELKREFSAAIDDFLLQCKEEGVKPEKSASGQLMLRVPPELHSAALITAQSNGMSLNQWAVQTFEQAVAA
jgi:predicted HicB family RNase H-like nuclease